MSYLAPCISEAGDYLSFDFTEYAWYNAPAEFSAWLADGWSGMTALGLAGSQRDGMGWITETMMGEASRYAYFSLRFYPEDETGATVDLNCGYTKTATHLRRCGAVSGRFRPFRTGRAM